MDSIDNNDDLEDGISDEQTRQNRLDTRLSRSSRNSDKKWWSEMKTLNLIKSKDMNRLYINTCTCDSVYSQTELSE